MQQGNTTPPVWSGVFWEQEDGTGYMPVAWVDHRSDFPVPDGWQLMNEHETDEALVFVYRKAL